MTKVLVDLNDILLKKIPFKIINKNQFKFNNMPNKKSLILHIKNN